MKKKIALLTTGWSYEYIFSVMNGIEKAIEGEEIDLYLFLCYGYADETPAFNQGEYNIFNLIDYKRFDGVILFGNILNSLEVLEREKGKIQKAGIPAVSLEYEVDGLDYVGTDNYSGMHEMTEHLIQEHHVQNFAYISGPDDNYESLERKKAFFDVLKENNVSIREEQVFLHGNWSYEFAYDAVVNLIKNCESLPEAIVCVNDEGAIAAVTALHKAGIRVPEDILVTGFDDTESASLFTPSITTVNRNWDCLGQEAILHILRKIRKEEVEHQQILLSRTVKRGSCGCVHHSEEDQKNYCMNRFYQQKQTLSFNRHIRHIEEIFIEAEEPRVLWKSIREYLLQHHELEGSEFCFMMENRLIPRNVEFIEPYNRKKGYSGEMYVVFHVKDNEEMPCQMMKTRQLIPESMQDEKNNVFTFVPFHFQDTVLGYYVSKNSRGLIENRFCYDWSKGISNGMAKFCQKYTFALMNKKLNELYIRDSMTGLLNRFGYKIMAQSLFEENQKTGKNTVIIFSDINSMKGINDKYGHLHGDLAIKTVAEIIQKNFPEDWLKIRYGGDEYMVIGSEQADRKIEEICEKVTTELARRVHRMALPYVLTISIGYKIVSADSKMSLEDAVNAADEIMYDKKTEYYKENDISGRANRNHGL